MAAEAYLKDSLKVAPSQNSLLARGTEGDASYDDRDVNWLRGDSTFPAQPTLVVVANLYGYVAIAGQKGLDIAKFSDIKDSFVARSSLHGEGAYSLPAKSTTILSDVVIDALSLSYDDAHLAVRIGTECRVYRFSDIVHSTSKLTPAFSIQLANTNGCRQFWGWSKSTPSKFMCVSDGSTCTVINGTGAVEKEHRLPFPLTAACWHGDSILVNSSSGGLCSIHPGSTPTPVCGPPSVPGPRHCVYLLPCDSDTVLGVWAAEDGATGGDSLFVGALDRQPAGTWSLQMLPTAFPALGGEYPVHAQTCTGAWLEQWDLAVLACNCMSKVAMLMKVPARSVPGKSAWIVQDPADTDILIPTCTNAQGWQETVTAGMAVLTADVGLGRVPKSALVTAAADDVYDLGPAILLHASNGVVTTFHCVPDGKRALQPFPLTQVKQVPALPPLQPAAAAAGSTMSAPPASTAPAFPSFGAATAVPRAADPAPASFSGLTFGAAPTPSKQAPLSFAAPVAVPAAAAPLPTVPALPPAASKAAISFPVPAPVPPAPVPAAPVGVAKTKSKVTMPEPAVPVVAARSAPSASAGPRYKGWKESHAGLDRTLTAALSSAPLGSPAHQYCTQLQAAIERCDGVVKGLVEGSRAAVSSDASRAQESSILTALSALGPGGVYDTQALREKVQGAERVMQGSAQPKAEAARLASAVASSVVSRAEEAAARASALAAGRVPGAPLSLSTPAMPLDPWTEEACRRARAGVSMLSARIQTLQGQVERSSAGSEGGRPTLLDLTATARKLDMKAAAEQDRVQQVKAAVEALSKELSLSVSVDMIADRIRTLAMSSTHIGGGGGEVAESKEVGYGEERDRRGYSMPRHLRRSPSHPRSSYASESGLGTGRFTSPMKPAQYTQGGAAPEEAEGYEIPQGALSLLRAGSGGAGEGAGGSYSRPSWSLTRVPTRLAAEGRAYALTTALWGPATGAGHGQQPTLRYTRFAAPAASTPAPPLSTDPLASVPTVGDHQEAAAPSALQAVLAAGAAPRQAAAPAPAPSPAVPLVSSAAAPPPAPVPAATAARAAATTSAFSFGSVHASSSTPAAPALPSFGGLPAFGATSTSSLPSFGGTDKAAEGAKVAPVAAATFSFGAPAPAASSLPAPAPLFGAAPLPSTGVAAPVASSTSSAAAAAAALPAPSSAGREKEEAQARKMLRKYKSAGEYVEAYVERKQLAAMCRYVSEGSAVPEHRGLAQEHVEAVVLAVLQEDEERSFEDCWAVLQSRCGGAPTTPYLPRSSALEGEARDRYSEYERIVLGADPTGVASASPAKPAATAPSGGAAGLSTPARAGGLNRALQFGTPAPADTTTASTIAGLGPVLGALDTTAGSTVMDGPVKEASAAPAPFALQGTGGAAIPSFTGGLGAVFGGAPKAAGSAFSFGAGSSSSSSAASGAAAAPAPAPTAPPSLSFGPPPAAAQSEGGKASSSAPDADAKAGSQAAAGSAFSFGSLGGALGAAPAPPPAPAFGALSGGALFGGSGAGGAGGVGSSSPASPPSSDPSFPGVTDPRELAHLRKLVEYMGRANPANGSADKVLKSWAKNGTALWETLRGKYGAAVDTAPYIQGLDMSVKPGAGGAAPAAAASAGFPAFGAAPAPAAATQGGAFSAFTTTAPAPASTAFGAAAAPSAFGGFGSGAASAFGAPAPASAFGAPAPAPAFGAPASAFGAPAPAPAFGAPAPAPAFGAPASAFGAPAPAPAFGAPAPAPAFGAPAPAPAFGAPASSGGFGGFGTSTGASPFGAAAPAFGAPASAPAPPSFGGFAAPAAAAPAFGGFGAASAPSAGTGFGAPAPAFGAPAPGAFGGGSGAFSFGGSTGGFMAAGLRK